MAHKGTSTFIFQRATAALLIPLVLWFLVSVFSQLSADLETARAWAARPLNAFLLAVFLIIGAAHMRIGVSEVIADYIHGSLKIVLEALNWLAALAVMAGGIYAAYVLSFAG
ncbi:MAG: succinate dehydrogenase, hydrophobic membrane anchor protein [Pseudomonadota bacterium]